VLRTVTVYHHKYFFVSGIYDDVLTSLTSSLTLSTQDGSHNQSRTPPYHTFFGNGRVYLDYSRLHGYHSPTPSPNHCEQLFSSKGGWCASICMEDTIITLVCHHMLSRISSRLRFTLFKFQGIDEHLKCALIHSSAGHSWFQ
jgi:hypothetical protein